MTKALMRFTIEPEGDGFILNFEDEDGDVFEFLSDREQLELLAEALDDLVLSESLDAELHEEDDES